MIKVRNEVKIYEKNGEETKMIDGPIIVVESHWNHNDRVNIAVNGGPAVTVVARDLIAAITNATNSARF